MSPIDWEDEEAWLRGVIIRLRTLKDDRVEAGLKDIVGVPDDGWTTRNSEQS